MKAIEKIIIFFVVVCLVSVVSYNVVMNNKVTKYLYDRNKLCEQLTTSLKEQMTENSTCIDYYCYYAPYAPPEGSLGNKTTTLCICDCKLMNGTIATVQILSATPTTVNVNLSKV
jgi:hypothetical protein